MMPALQTHGLSKCCVLLTNYVVLICQFKKLKCPEQVKSLSRISSPSLLPGTIWCWHCGSGCSEQHLELLGGSSSPPAPHSNWVCEPGMLTPSSLTISESGFKSQLVFLHYLPNPYLNWPGRKRGSGSVSCRTELSCFPSLLLQTAGRHGWVASSPSRKHFALSLPPWPMTKFHLTFSSQKCKVRKQNLCII